jgi:hypothetical protein
MAVLLYNSGVGASLEGRELDVVFNGEAHRCGAQRGNDRESSEERHPGGEPNLSSSI